MLQIAYFFKIFDLRPIEEQVRSEQKEAFLVAEKKVATAKAIETVKSQLEENIQKARVAMEVPAQELRNFKWNSPVVYQLETIIDFSRLSMTTPGASRQSTPLDDPNAQITDPQPETPTYGERILTPLEVIRVAELEKILTQMRNDFLAKQAELAMVGEFFPMVVAEMERLMALISAEGIKLDAARYLELIKWSITSSSPSETGSPSFDLIERKGNFIFDNLTTNSEVISLLLELPEVMRLTDLVLLKDSTDRSGGLRTIYEKNGTVLETAPVAIIPTTPQLADTAASILDAADKEPPIVPLTADELWEQQRVLINQYYADLSRVEAAAAQAGLRIHTVEVAENLPEAAVAQIDATLKSLFKPTVVEYQEPEPNEDEEEEQEDNEDETSSTMFDRKAGDVNSEKSRPVGDTAEYCPVALKELATLWPGNAEHGLLTYKDKIYTFSTSEAKEKFTKDPDSYLPVSRPLPV
ncbi:hypothetical protein BV898_06913 [Hypsibius exemplaris]|uniref:Uncharacterized protein n=1 Tax=Hypsibius exemplaris TaxID=2072580 RepID=A0A1W0WV57_HYPEX|nr:hypothetical protein BV898_06913 [Hypsibius exemplaris]